MSVVVKGMHMPPVCVTDDGWYGNCPMDRVWCAMRFKPEYEEGQRIIDEITGKRPDWCPLRPLPEKHGRLGDLDAIMNKLAEDKREAFTKHDVWLMLSRYGAETLVEAEGE